MKSEKSLNILGTSIAPVNIPKVIQLINKRKEHYPGFITVTGVHGLIESMRDEKVREAHNKSWLTVPDGMPLVYIGRLSGFKSIMRCYGPDLMASIMEASANGSISHFFYGGNEGVADRLREVFELRYPGIKIIGTYTPPFRPLNRFEEDELIGMLNKLKPDLMWIGLSTPKQEMFMYEYIAKLNVKIMIGVGAAFDIHTGIISSAPKFLQKLSLEWLYRLFQEPKRLWRRYLFIVPVFIFLYILESLKLIKFTYYNDNL